MTTHSLQALDLTVGYGERLVLRHLELEIPIGEVTVIVGANASGKSTLLHALARLRRPRGGQVLLDGADIHRIPTVDVAKVVGLLPQAPTAPEGLTVRDLISRGRYPRQGWIRRWSASDEQAVGRAMELTGTADLADRPVDQLSGGQRQRVWIALSLAQETDLLLLDEPTTFLDLAHQIDVLELLRDLNAGGVTIVMVLHELNHAARYADHLVAVKNGTVVAHGRPAAVMTEQLVHDVFGMAVRVMTDPVSGAPMVIPLGRYAAKRQPAR